MKSRIVGSVLCLSLTSLAANAAIENASWWDDNDKVLVCGGTSVITDQSGQMSLSMTGNHKIADAGHMVGTITTDTPDDPTLTLGSSVDNDTGANWIGYRVNVYMNSFFTLKNSSITTPSTWSQQSISQPILDTSKNQYVVSMYFAGSPEIAVGESIEFSYQMVFSGKTSYAFTQEMIPVFASAPEPSVFGMIGGLLVGGAGLLRLRKTS